MGLANTYVLPTNRIPDLFKKIQDGQAPDSFTQQLLRDWGFTSTNDRAFIPLLKALGFLNADGKPTARYNEYRDHSRSKQVLGQAVREAYEDLFLIKEHPTAADRTAIEGKFKSYHNVSDHVAGLMTKTFYGLLGLADITKRPALSAPSFSAEQSQPDHKDILSAEPPPIRPIQGASLNYNIQIHLPATKDTEVYNAIFKALKVHLID